MPASTTILSESTSMEQMQLLTSSLTSLNQLKSNQTEILSMDVADLASSTSTMTTIAE